MEPITNPLSGISILLVEDDEATLELLTRTLPKKYPEALLHTAINGRTGLDLFITLTPDIVITDINMPEMDGKQMVEKIRAINPDTKFIVITGKSENTFLQNLTADGAYSTIFLRSRSFSRSCSRRLNGDLARQRTLPSRAAHCPNKQQLRGRSTTTTT